MNVSDRSSSPSGMGLRIERLRLNGENDRLLLDVPSLAIPKSQSVAIRGASGAGKTTFIHALCGLARPVSGRITWENTDLTLLKDAEAASFRRTNLGLIFQDFMLFEELSSIENAAIAEAFHPRGRRKAIRTNAAYWLNRLGIDPKESRTVDSYSGGERQRIAVARALAHDPTIIVADEPTANLDRTAADQLADDLTALARADGRTLIVVTHDDRFAAGLDRVLRMEHGRIVDDSEAQK